MADQEPAGLKEQNEKFKEYKAPEKVYKKWTPNKTAQGKAFTGVSPMDFYMRQNAAKKAERSKETEQKQSLYKNNMMKAAFTD
mmetsp:Transcript_6613/g.13148  ORF Transcript_6613/g.13148 Transcript_6613/m.13148 type:complete len:83 (-) Transcript_6613:189-437(-)